MIRYIILTLGVAATLFLTVAHGQAIKVPVSTRYITTKITTLSTGETKTFIASLCNQFQGATINATVLLSNNPSWNPDIGTLMYYIVDDAAKAKKDALCNNTDAKGVDHESCVIPKLTGADNLYLKADAGPVAAISFSIDIEITNPKGFRVNKVSTKPKSCNVTADAEYLTELVTVETSQRLPYQKEAILDITFCPNSFTTDNYRIESLVFGIDNISSYTQYVCDKLPCTVKSAFAYNGKQVPSNEVVITTQSAQYKRIYVLIVCWAGEYDPSVKTYVGEFQYSATLVRNTP